MYQKYERVKPTRRTTLCRNVIPLAVAAFALAGCSESPVGEYAAQLNDDDHEVRYDAAKELENLGPEAARAAPELAAALSDPVPRVRYRSAKALSKLGLAAADAADELAAALRAESIQAKTRYYVVKTLANIEEFAVVALPDLTALLAESGDAKVRYYAAKAIGKIGRDATSAISALETASKDADPKVRKAAAYALEKVRPS